MPRHAAAPKCAGAVALVALASASALLAWQGAAVRALHVAQGDVGRGRVDSDSEYAYTPPDIKMLLCTMIRNESNYLVEWIEFHKLQGFDHVRIWDNTHAADGSPYIHNTLAKYYPSLDDAGISVVWPYKGGQGEAFNKCTA